MKYLKGTKVKFTSSRNFKGKEGVIIDYGFSEGDYHIKLAETGEIVIEHYLSFTPIDSIVSHHIKCNCGSHILQVSCDVELHTDGVIHKEWFLSMFTYGYGSGKPSLIWRLKTAWKVLTKGTMHEDSICMNYDEVEQLKKFLDDTTIK